MPGVALVTLLGLVYSCALFGWGRLLQRVLHLSLPAPFAICVGLSAWIFVGGVLNLLGLAHALALDGVVIAGLAYLVPELVLSRNPAALASRVGALRSEFASVRLLPSAGAILAVFAFSARTLAAPRAFNMHDDLEKYLSHPVRMLATGTLAGSPFSALASESLGGQAFLQGFALAHWPAAYVNAVDSVFAFVLCLACVLGACLRLRLPSWYVPLVVLVPVFINPQYVNTAALYTVSAVTISLFLIPFLGPAEDGRRLLSWRFLVFVGLSYAALLALKTIYLLLVLTHWLLVLLGILLASRSPRAAVAWAVRTAATTVLFAAPWLLLHHGQWTAWLQGLARPGGLGLGGGVAGHAAPAVDLFSTEALVYGFGAGLAHYTAAVLVAVLGGSCLLGCSRAAEGRFGRMATAFGAAACATAPILYVGVLLVLSPVLTGPGHALRYLCPVVIAAVPCGLIIGAAAAAETARARPRRLARLPLLALAVSAASVLVAFGGTLAGRIGQAWRYGSVLSFSQLATDPAYLEYSAYALGPVARGEIRRAQAVVPAGATLLAWTPLALHLDYRRNAILDVDPAGLATPWCGFPFGRPAGEAIEHLLRLQCRHVLWQYDGPAVRSQQGLLEVASRPYPRTRLIGFRTYQFVDALRAMVARSRILYDDGTVVVVELDGQPSPMAQAGARPSARPRPTRARAAR